MRYFVLKERVANSTPLCDLIKNFKYGAGFGEKFLLPKLILDKYQKLRTIVLNVKVKEITNPYELDSLKKKISK